ncbi:MAG: hypothetical protein HY791_07260 [Deltaproteobacteria bacterium]|nr:hypothetical protein [Deltaproteobacteria bacterium]
MSNQRWSSILRFYHGSEPGRARSSVVSLEGVDAAPHPQGCGLLTRRLSREAIAFGTELARYSNR